MKQKYIVLKNPETNDLFIREFNEAEKDILALVYESVYARDIVEAAIKNGKEALIGVLRTEQMYPPKINIDRIADSVIELYASNAKDSIELLLDDMDSFVKQKEMPDNISGDIKDIEHILDDDSLTDKIDT
jgi:hypothetical protein